MDPSTTPMPVVVHIDDEADLLEVTRIALQSLPVRFFGIISAQAGLQTVRFIRPALVLLDIMLPDLDGWELLRRMKADAALGKTKVAIYSALSRTTDRARAQSGGADLYLAKPCSPAELVRVVAQLTGVPLPGRALVVRSSEPPPAVPSSPSAPSAPPASETATGKAGLPSLELTRMPAAVIDFIDRFLDTPLSLELLTYLHDNPERGLTLEAAARALGRRPNHIQPLVRQLAERGLIVPTPSAEGDIYKLTTSPSIRKQLAAFFAGCEDEQVRSQAMYRIIRRQSKWR